MVSKKQWYRSMVQIMVPLKNLVVRWLSWCKEASDDNIEFNGEFQVKDREFEYLVSWTGVWIPTTCKR